jgi:hypothetical protein
MRKLKWCYASVIASLILLASCGSSSEAFRLEGRFRNLNQGQFYVYNEETGQKDTIQVRDGRFEYERMLDRPTVLMMVFPNFSEMPLFAESGVTLSMKGDATHLRETVIKGSDPNEEMTELRMNLGTLSPTEQRKLVKSYIEDHPSSPIACYLVDRFFVQTVEPDYQEAYRLAGLVAGEQAENIDAKRLVIRLKPLKNRSTKGRLPKFSARDTNGKTVNNSKLKASANVIVVWASWSYDSHSYLHMLRRKQVDHPGKLSVVSICLDADKNEGQGILKRDSIEWPNVCDGRMWQTPLLSQLGLATMGGNILTDKDGRILARDLENSQLRDKLEEMLK